MSRSTSADLDQAIRREYRHDRMLRVRDLGLAILTPVLLLIIWELLALVGVLDRRLFTPPSEIVVRAAEMTVSGQILPHVVATVARLASGFVLGAIVGIAVGLLMGLSRPMRAALAPTFTALYALPKIAILPLLLLIFGLTETPKVLSVAISVFFVVQINTLAGIVQIDDRTLEAARAYRATGWKLFRYVLLPAATPSIMTGLRVAAGMAVIVITAVEFVASDNGLGYLIWNSWQLFQPSTMFVGLITVSLIGAVVTGLIILLERAMVPWRSAGRSRRIREVGTR
ncbi:ABC transporter permease [Microlunatus soli]|uniref:NitT/TauT family transport system permease protein n=1 Tax=Microlunatus soli TaxID=630515 RepID=A0A1H1TCL2_9ACTN|nr:ABC transporter permease [Microlunatus soli]SDS57706.1 NitT/TauT family transport system permease protein [Microlunatus soli]